MFGLHIKHCGMTQCDVDPSIKEYVFVITWTDDVRYFGTPKFVTKYEQDVPKHIKCKFEGLSKEFVSITISHDLQSNTLELTQVKYWENAVERFKEFLPPNGAKKRGTPLSISEYALLTDPSDEEVKAGSHLPFPQLIGVLQYPAAFTKLEMRFAVSSLSRFRGRWGVVHFAAALKALEYGFTTRAMGILYTKPVEQIHTNALIAYADSGFGTPRSQGCSLIMMNGGAISLSSKRHTTTDDSTTAAELTQLHLCSCEVMGLRNLMDECGLHQELPTIVFQDNKPAVQIALNRGALSKKTRSMSLRVLSVRNKIEDGFIYPELKPTDKMLADIGTKATDISVFQSMRDQINGYMPIIG